MIPGKRLFAGQKEGTTGRKPKQGRVLKEWEQVMNVKTSRRWTPYTMEEQRGHNLLEAVCEMDDGYHG